MKKLLIAFIALISFTSIAQIEDPTEWSLEVEKLSDTNYKLITTVIIEPGWHVNSQVKVEAMDGPIPTEFAFFGDGYELVGDNNETGSYAMFEKTWKRDVYQFDNVAIFEQEIKLTDASLKYIPVEVYFQVCDAEKCLPPSPKAMAFKIDASVSVDVSQVVNDYYDQQIDPVIATGPDASEVPAKDHGNKIENPTSWNVVVEKLSDTNYKLITKIDIESGWHVNSQVKVDAIDGPIPTEFAFFGDGYELVGDNKETGSYSMYEKTWKRDVYQFDNEAVFEQEIKLTDRSLKYIPVEVYFQVCDSSKCLPPSPKALVFKIDPKVEVDATKVVNDYYDQQVDPVIAVGPEASDLKAKDHEDKNSDNKDNKGLWAIFLGCLVAGIFTLATPCVFPMIPMTVSFFTKQKGGKFQGILYGFFILLIYVLCSLPFHLFESVSPDIFNEFSTNPWLNIFFFVIFIIFAISFFGAFEITMPNSLINKVDKASNVGGIIGIFFMALTLVLVSFSCTGPVIGAVLGSVLSTDGGATALTVGMAGFGFGLGIPFALFAIFPSWMNNLPKSGGWLNTVKVFLGFLELAFAFKFLSNADLVMQWHYLEREVFVAIWIAIFGTLGLYLFGKIKLPHDGPDQNISVGRLLLGLTSIIFALYLIPGLWGAPLKLISGFPPPSTYAESPYGVGFKKQSAGGADAIALPKGAHYAEHDIIAFYDYDKGLAYAKEVNKPVLVDFTGWACVNCRKMEQLVWSEPEILPILKNEVVLISLYVDERKELPKDKQYVSETTGKRIRTVGNKWSDLQIERYRVNAQPFYAIQNLNGEDIIAPVGYTPDVQEYHDWLQKGVSAF